MATSYLEEIENFRKGARTMQEAWTAVSSRFTEENGSLSRTMEELRRENGALQRRLQASERELLDMRQQLESGTRQLEEFGNHKKLLTAQLFKWKNMTQTFQRMFTETAVDDSLPLDSLLVPSTVPADSFFSRNSASFQTFSPPREKRETYTDENAGRLANAVERTELARMPGALSSRPNSECAPDTRVFLTEVRERLPPPEAKAIVELVKTLRCTAKTEAMDKGTVILGQHEDLLTHLAAICDRCCV